MVTFFASAGIFYFIGKIIINSVGIGKNKKKDNEEDDEARNVLQEDDEEEEETEGREGGSATNTLVKSSAETGTLVKEKGGERGGERGSVDELESGGRPMIAASAVDGVVGERGIGMGGGVGERGVVGGGVGQGGGGVGEREMPDMAWSIPFERLRYLRRRRTLYSTLIYLLW